MQRRRHVDSRLWPALALGLVALLSGCATVEEPGPRPLTAEEGRALVTRLLPESVKERGGWATDIYAAFATLGLAPTPENICAAVAVTEQESGFQVDPVVPGLAAITRKEIERRRESAGIPRFALDAALALSSSNGKTYGERLDAARTERQLSEIYEDFIDGVPFGKRLLADRNPVRTGGPMQVRIDFAQRHLRDYPYPLDGSVRGEVFSRRGGLYFGIKHLLGYPADYQAPLYRFADFNAGWYASRNAAFQQAAAIASGTRLARDGDLLTPGAPIDRPGATEAALRAIAPQLGMDAAGIRAALASGDAAGFADTALYRRVFALADGKGAGRPVARARVPDIALASPKISRKLTTAWFASRVEARWKHCMAR